MNTIRPSSTQNGTEKIGFSTAASSSASTPRRRHAAR